MDIQSKAVDLPLKWESRDTKLELADGFPTKNKNTDATIVRFQPIKATIKFENKPSDRFPKWSWKFQEDVTEDNGYMGYSWSEPFGYADKDFYKEDGFGNNTKVLVTLSMSENMQNKGKWWANIVEIQELPEEAVEKPAKENVVETIDATPKGARMVDTDSKTANPKPISKEDVLKEKYRLQLGVANLMGVPFDSDSDDVFDTQQRIAISVGYNNLTLTYNAILSNLKDVLASHIYTKDEILEMKDILHESYKLSNSGYSAYIPRYVREEITFNGETDDGRV